MIEIQSVQTKKLVSIRGAQVKNQHESGLCMQKLNTSDNPMLDESINQYKELDTGFLEKQRQMYQSKPLVQIEEEKAGTEGLKSTVSNF